MIGSELYIDIRNAIKSQDVLQLTVLLSEPLTREIIDTVDTSGDTLLHLAVKLSRTKEAELLVQAKESLNVLNSEAQTSLYLAFYLHRYELATLLASAGACIDPAYEAEHANELRLWTAVLRGDLDELRRRIDAGDSVDQAPQGGKAKGWTALWLAMRLDREDAARMLIQAGADVTATDNTGHTLLHLALVKGDCDIARMLIEAGADVNSFDRFDWTPLHLASHGGYLEITKILVETGAKLEATDNDGSTPLHWAAANGHTEVARLLVEAGAYINTTDNESATPLHDALSTGQLEIAKLLVEAGAGVQLLDKCGHSPLHLLLSTADYKVTSTDIQELFNLLTDAGATVDGATATISPLVPSDVIRAIVPEDTHFWLAANNDAPMLAAELAGGLNPNMKTENGMTLLHWACAGDAPECVQLLFDAGADKEAKTEDEVEGDDDFESECGATSALLASCMHESAECLQHLIANDENVNQVYHYRLPLHFALAANSPACVTALVGAGAWVTEEEMDDECYCSTRHLESALHMRTVPVDALRALLAAAGERVLGKKIGGMPPLYWAVENSTVDGLRVLVEAGADVNEKHECQNLLEHLLDTLSKESSYSSVSRLTAIVDYLKSMPCFSEEL